MDAETLLQSMKCSDKTLSGFLEELRQKMVWSE